ncbi:MAG: hypothetical protein IAE86_09540 [Burkholderiaceae bacterium]|nr:hypothetical protein [Burkholderiaceae bacterium]
MTIARATSTRWASRVAQIDAAAGARCTIAAIVAGERFSGLFTDISYILSVPHPTTFGRLALLPPLPLNRVGVVIMLRGYRQARP